MQISSRIIFSWAVFVRKFNNTLKKITSISFVDNIFQGCLGGVSQAYIFLVNLEFKYLFLHKGKNFTPEVADVDGQQTSHIAIVCLLTRSISCNKDFEMKVLL